ncbi:aminodeoxychorismate synthase component I [Marinomonas ostreistagni]|uniref:aminodeoxychorismate synthase component I n=1 Tax=Marinomonas ostreistagni TaxID=359209 RepID=UPI00194DB07C|nr:aminodeoxychorismate synthase component I [Marinomonas ostreistagni]MBM6549669.1 aminodeoxychorismate synthase component I [Marinomonas ostreistagni]
MAEVKLISLPYESSLATLFPKFSHLPYPTLLDSNHPHFKDTRFDILSAAPLAMLEAQGAHCQLHWFVEPVVQIDAEQPLDILTELVAQMTCQPWANDTQVPFNGGLLGYYGYEAGRYVEQLPQTVIEDVNLPTILMGLYGWAIVTDHQQQQTQLVITPWSQFDEQTLLDLLGQEDDQTLAQPFALNAAFEANMTAAEYAERFQKVQDYIQAGDCYQVNLTQRFSAPYQGQTWQAYQALKAACPTPFGAYMVLPDGRAVLSHSPERFIQSYDNRVESKPIKGTRPRGETPEQDKALADELLNSEKDRAENLMIVDLLRNDLGKNCLTGSIRVPKLFALESYANVHHMVSTVEGRVATPADTIKVFQESFPGGSITGAPKVRAMQIIDELEPHERSVYCGSFVYFGANGQMDSSITIRTMIADGERMHCWAGGGLVADSICAEEYQETFTKIGKLTHTLETQFLK